MGDKYQGGPAFPCDDVFGDGGRITKASAGMTLRDYFAAQVLGHLIAGDAIGGRKVANLADYAAGAYQAADAMLKERAK